MAGNTPSTPKKMPFVPTGPTANKKSSPSKVMNPMGKAGSTSMKGTPPKTKRSVSPKNQSQTVDGGPKN